jgi:hypothetical protein
LVSGKYELTTLAKLLRWTFWFYGWTLSDSLLLSFLKPLRLVCCWQAKAGMLLLLQCRGQATKLLLPLPCS